MGGSLTRLPANASRRLTPASSTSSSPRHLPISLPPISPRRASFFRRDSVERGPVISRPSLTVSLGGPVSLNNSASPGDRSTPNLRHVGEGVLDDDSDSSGGSEGDGEGEETAAPYSTDEDSTSKPRISPGVGPLGQANFRLSSTPSPLSRIARGSGKWDENRMGKANYEDDDDDDVSSPSPRSTSDTETDSQVLTPHRKHGISQSRSQSRSAKNIRKASDGKIVNSRSRSSTVASLAAPPPQRPKPLSHQDSFSSIRTVTAAETSILDHNMETGRPMQNGCGQDSRPGHTRQRSLPLSEYMLNSSTRMSNLKAQDKGVTEIASENFITERRIELIQAEDKRYREITLAALKNVVEKLSEEVFKVSSPQQERD